MKIVVRRILLLQETKEPLRAAHQDNTPLISVIIPFDRYKRQEVALQAIYSAASQTYANVEVIVVDVSGQNLQAALTEKTRHPDKVLSIAQPNGTYAGYVRNYGIRSCNGDYLAFLDADDAFLPRKLELQMRYARALGVLDFSSTEAYLSSECRFQNGAFVPWRLEEEWSIHDPKTFPLYNAENYKQELARLAAEKSMIIDGANLPPLWDLEFLEWHNCAITR
jgi:glycosyltransferase involved in cell wall biosynthesis